jgi:hypothetical protein
MAATGRRALLACSLLTLGLASGLSGCASFNHVSADVSSYGQWPLDRTQPRYVFERLPSQQANADQQTRIEQAAAPELARKGFVRVEQADQAEVLVQVAMQVRTAPAVYDDPYYRPMDGRFFGGVFSVGGIWGNRGGLGVGVMLEPPRSQMQVDVLVRDRRTGQTVYETHANHQRVGAAYEGLMPALFRAALFDFPAPGISPRRVTVDLSAAAPASAASSASAAASAKP